MKQCRSMPKFQIEYPLNHLIMRIKVAISCIFFCFATALLGQNNAKLAPSFRFLKERQLNKSTNSAIPSVYAKMESKRYNRSAGLNETGYNCIIYTQFPEVLKANGITLESIHPTFSVAWLSLDQIAKVTSLPKVSYVDAPKTVKKNKCYFIKFNWNSYVVKKLTFLIACLFVMVEVNIGTLKL